jgi:hypothetical protein
MLIVDEDLQILTTTPNAERWLDELTDGFPRLPKGGSSWLPEVVRSVVARARQLHGSDAPEDHMPRARVRGSSGRWLAIYASRTRETGSGAENTAVIIEEARPSEIAPLIMHAYGLSPREARVTSMVLQGLSTKEINPTARSPEPTARSPDQKPTLVVTASHRLASAEFPRLTSTSGLGRPVLTEGKNNAA